MKKYQDYTRQKKSEPVYCPHGKQGTKHSEKLLITSKITFLVAIKKKIPINADGLSETV